MGSHIVLKNIIKRFQQPDHTITAINGISSHFEDGSFWMIAGSSGSGKTTLLQLIGGIEKPTFGEINIGSVKLHEMNEKHLARFRRNHVGFIFQGNNLIPSLTVMENIELPLYLNGIPNREKQVDQMLVMVGLEHKKKSFPQHLSGGEQQRAAIARAIIHRPKMVLADEPTANLDSITSLKILELLQELNKEIGSTVLFATHDPNLIENKLHTLKLFDGSIDDH